MNLGEIIDIIWNMSWYKVLVIAAVDDAILLIKLWPVYIFFIIVVIIIKKVMK